MPTQAVRGSANSITSMLEERNMDTAVAAVVISGSTAGGIIATQRLANRLLPRLGFDPMPTTLADAMASAGLKGGIGVGAGAIATRLGGIGMVAAAFAAMGAFASAGVDLLSVFLDMPELRAMQSSARAASAAQPRSGSGGNRQRRRRPQGTSSGSDSVTVSADGGRNVQQATAKRKGARKSGGGSQMQSASGVRSL